MVQWKILSCLALVTVYAGTIDGCLNNTIECDNMKEYAMYQRDADKRCQEMTKYLNCFKADIADCAEGTKSTDYPQNLVNMYCNKATLCSAKLSRCYENFTNYVIEKIVASDAAAQQALCGPLAVQIMGCTDRVTADCSDQPGLLETVSSRQASFNATCGQSVPCVFQILQCQAPILALSVRKPIPQTAEGQDSQVTVTPDPPCEDMASKYCSVYTQTVECMRNQSQACGSSDIQIGNILTTLQESAKAVCSDEMICPAKMSQCLCHIQISPADPYSGVCANLPDVRECITKMPESCYELPDIKETMNNMNQQYGSIYTSLCQSPGICLQAVQCGLSIADSGVTGTTSTAEGLDLSTFCARMQPVFQCLSSSIGTCSVDQSKVTFTQIQAKFTEFCQATVPHAAALASCNAYATCSRSFERFPNMSAMSGGQLIDAAAMEATKVHLRSMTDTGFWCRYIEHRARCVVASSAACNLPGQFATNVRGMHQSLMQLCGIADQVTTSSPTQGTTQGNTNKGAANAGESSGGSSGAEMLQRSFLFLITAAFAISFLAL